MLGYWNVGVQEISTTPLLHFLTSYNSSFWLFDISRESKLKFALLRCQKPGNQECKLQFATEPEYFTGIIKEPSFSLLTT